MTDPMISRGCGAPQELTGTSSDASGSRSASLPPGLYERDYRDRSSTSFTGPYPCGDEAATRRDATNGLAFVARRPRGPPQRQATA